MNKKKLIGTIIGVVLFAALVAGATYAWLTITFNATNGNYNIATRNFNINYVNGDAIGEVPMLSTPTPNTASSLVVSASRNADSLEAELYLKLTSTDNAITRSGALNYAVCSGNSSDSAKCTDFENVLAKGTIITTATDEDVDKNVDGTQVTRTLNEQKVDTDGNLVYEDDGTTPVYQGYTVVNTPDAPTYYWIYFWLDPAKVTNAMLEVEYSGYIHASAMQIETTTE